jgi:hypothetical protein
MLKSIKGLPQQSLKLSPGLRLIRSQAALINKPDWKLKSTGASAHLDFNFHLPVYLLA